MSEFPSCAVPPRIGMNGLSMLDDTSEFVGCLEVQEAEEIWVFTLSYSGAAGAQLMQHLAKAMKP